MNALDTFPPAPHPLPEALPQFNPSTAERLIHWGRTQPGSLPWLVARGVEYFAKFPVVTDEHHRRVDCAAALDLLRWRLAAPSNRAAVEHLLSDHDQKPTKP